MILDIAVIKEKGIEATKEMIEKAMPLLKEKYAEVHDAETEEGYGLNKQSAKELQQYRIGIDKAHKSAKGPIIKRGKEIDALKNISVPVIQELESKFKNANLDVDERKEREAFEKEQAEQDRIQSIQNRLNNIDVMPMDFMDRNSDDILVEISRLESIKDCKWAEELYDLATITVENTLSRLTKMASFKKDQEEHEVKVAVEEKRLAEEQMKREEEEKERQAKIAKENKVESDRLAKIKEDQDTREQKIKADEDAAIERKRLDKIEVERRIAYDKEEAELKAAVKREEDRIAAKEKAEEEDRKARSKEILKSRVAVENSIINTLFSDYGMTKKKATQLVKDVVEGSFSELEIVY